MGEILDGDCLEQLATFPENHFDALVTDPPAGISFMGKVWDGDRGGREQWIAWMTQVAAECLRVMKPGAHGLVWALPRTSHWTATALEVAGFQIRDVVHHIAGTGFPKSMNVSKAIEKAAGAPADAERWAGFGTALKPAAENWILIRKPLSEKTVAANVLKWGTGALNIEASRVPGTPRLSGTVNPGASSTGSGNSICGSSRTRQMQYDANPPSGRFPANLILSHNPDCADGTEAVPAFDCTEGCAVATLDRQSGGTKPHGKPARTSTMGGVFGNGNAAGTLNQFTDSGGASRFFYCTKAGRSDRGVGNTHPTVKSTTLMRYLCTLVTPPNGRILDPFAGSGSTGVAALRGGFEFVGIEQNPVYAEIARSRIAEVPA